MDRLKNNGINISPGNFAESGLSNGGEQDDYVSPSENQLEIPETPELSAKKEEIKEELKKSQEEREEKDQEVADQLIIINGAKIKFNAHMGEFKVLTDVPTTQNKLTGTIVEKQIPNFTFYDGFQMISLTQWLEPGNVKVQENEVLLKKSKLPGVGKLPGNVPPETSSIEFVDSGQIHAPEKINTESAPLPDNDDLIKSPYLFYNINGEYLAGPTGDSELIYISTEKILPDNRKSLTEWNSHMKLAKKLGNKVDNSGLSHIDFKHFAATVLGESAAGFGIVIKEEIFAFASANDNFRKWYKEKKKTDLSYRKVISKTGAYATTSAQYLFYNKKSEIERNDIESMKFANAAVINAINNGTDYSNGAIKWSGIDIVSNLEKWREGYSFTNFDHDIFYLGNNPTADKWESRAAFFGQNEKKTNKWWKEYSTKTKGSPRALASYYTKSDDSEKIAKRKEEFFKNNTEHRFGTVFCRLTANYIKSQGGEFY